MFPLFQIGAGTLPNINIPDLSQVNIAELIFGILKIQPTGDMTSDLLNLLFFPHIVIVLWLFIVYSRIGTGHKGLGLLMSFAFYIFVIWNGWYAFIASAAQFWMLVTVGTSLVIFMLPKILHPSTTAARGMLLEKAGGKIWSRREQGKVIDRLKSDIIVCDEKMRELNIAYSATKAGDERRALEESRNAWRLRKADLEAKIRELERSKEFV
ncbi:MAG: hypothetical protein HY362_03820 [Candidatus Aenigmarchaeota archaeon]|nr:hypothetical protein [Candidatus Aenigmarchaeota archaeon]